MTEFDQNEHYFVFKKNYLNNVQINILNNMKIHAHHKALPKALVVEADWALYDTTKTQIERFLTNKESSQDKVLAETLSKLKTTDAKLKAAEQANQKLQSALQVSHEHEKRLAAERDNWKHKKFSWFNNEECWLFQDDGNDHLESLICPVVMSKDKVTELVEARTERNNLAQALHQLIAAIQPFAKGYQQHWGSEPNSDSASHQKKQDSNEVVPRSTMRDWRKLTEAAQQCTQTLEDLDLPKTSQDKPPPAKP